MFSFPTLRMPFGNSRGRTTRKPATAPRPDKATAIRTARHRDQAVRRLKQEAKNLALYGVAFSVVQQALHEAYAEAAAQMQ